MVRVLLSVLFFGLNFNFLLAADYYVKTSGTGDGSSWENAMSPEDFEAYLPLASDSVTFHIAEGVYKPTKRPDDVSFGREGQPMFVAQSFVRLIGGYPADAKTGDAPNPALHKTIFSGDVNSDTKVSVVKGVDGRDSLVFSNNSDDLYCLFYYGQPHTEGINPTVAETDTAVYMNGILFRCAEAYALYLDPTYNAYAHMEKCIFENCSRWAVHMVQSALSFRNVLFRNNEIAFSRYDGEANRTRSLIFRQCTFDSNNRAFNIAGLYSGTMFLENSTLVNNYASQWADVNSYLDMTNCTVLNNGPFMGNRCYHGEKHFTMVGNIIDTLSVVSVGTKTTYFKVYGNYGNIGIGENAEAETNAHLPMPDKAALTTFLEGTYDSKSDIFKPMLSYKGGLSPTVALKSDTLPDGTSLRFPLSETTVTTDQRGAKRLVQTCRGAFEVNCVAVSTELADTVLLGEPYAFGGATHQFAKPGKVVLTDTLVTTLWCDSIVTLRLVVLPNPKQLEYYVKVDGKGDGSSWEKAMSAEDFAYFLPSVPDGATFHVAEGRYLPILDADGNVPVVSSSRLYAVNSNVSIIGGYPADAKTGALPEPEKYETVFSGDVLGDDKGDYENYDDNAVRIFEFKSGFYVCGLILEASNGRALSITGNDYESSRLVEKCLFRGNVSNVASTTGVVYHNTGPVSVFYLKNSHFYKNKGYLFANYYEGGSTDIISNCTFSENEGSDDDYNSLFFFCYGKEWGFCKTYNKIENSTFVKNKCKNLFLHEGGFSLYNNTFVDNELDNVMLTANCLRELDSLKSVGNLFLNAGASTLFTHYQKSEDCEMQFFSDYNLYVDVEIPSDLFGKHDLQGGKNGTNVLFDDANLSYNGGFTPTVALKSDTLPDGTSIRFPLSETTVTADQRGVGRLENTCMGAYEINCLTVKKTISDTILMGESYAFGDTTLLLAKPGRVVLNDTLTAVLGCDSIVTLQLVVRPDHSRNGYYVKVDGSGDGSDWEHAMGPEDFAAYLPYVYDGDTFHIAAGRYLPLQEVGDLGKGFEFNASVALVGGYPDTVTVVGTPSNPDLHKTILTADVRGNDDFTIYPHSAYVSLYGLPDNAQLLLYTEGAHTLSLYGLTMSGVVGCGHSVVNLNGSSLRMERCEVVKNNASAIKGKGGSVQVDNCYFADNVATEGTVFRLEDATLDVRSSAFERNVTVAGCGVDYEQTKGGVALLSDCVATFTNNTFNTNWSRSGGLFSIGATKEGAMNLSLVNNTLTGCGNIDTDKNEGSVVYSEGGASEVSLYANIIVGNGANPFAVAGGAPIKTVSDYNICDVETPWISGSKDMKIDPAEVSSILDGDYLANTAYFSGNLRLNGGYTPTVAVVASSFKGGEVLVIPQSARRVDADQRGFVRKDTSCVGAYEFPTFYDYYVKTKPAGDGSGRSWANAMGDTTFARYFPIVSNGATFHIAEGRYQPMLDDYGRVTASTLRAYRTNRLVNLAGGYPADAREGAVADPKANRTVLTADFNGDDEVTEANATFSLANRSDNGAYVMEISPRVSGWCSVSGIVFEGSVNPKRASSAALTLSSKNTKGVNYKLSQCAFERDIVGVYSITDSLMVSDCSFSYSLEKALGHNSRTMENPPYFMFDKNTMYRNRNALSLSLSGDAVIQNSTFAMNDVAIYLSKNSVGEGDLACALYNNTVSQSGNERAGVVLSGRMSFRLLGNILDDEFLLFNSDEGEALPTLSDYNLYKSASPWKMGDHDLLVTRKALSEVLDGTYEDATGVFNPALTENGGFGKNIALVGTSLPNGASVKMIPSGTTPVTDDQRYVQRDEVYCVGAYEVACGFKGAAFSLELSDGKICRDDTARVELAGLTKLEENTYKYEWSVDADSVHLLDGAGRSARFHVYAKRPEVRFSLKVTDVCGADTVLQIAQKVDGTADVLFGGLGSDGVVCASAGLMPLTTDAENALFEGECVVDGRYFDPSLAKGEFTRVRCWVGNGECRSFADREVRLYTREAVDDLVMKIEEKTLDNCLVAPEAMARISISDWDGNWRYELRGKDRKPRDWTLSADSVATLEYDSLRGGKYTFVVSDRCGAIDSLPFDIAFSGLDPSTIASLDSVAVNSLNCFGGETGDVTVFYSGNANGASLGVRLTKGGEVVSELFSAQEADTLLFSGLAFAEYEVSLYYVDAEECTMGMDGFVRRADVSRLDPFAVSFVPTKTLCQNSSDAVIRTVTKGGLPNYAYEWHEVKADAAEPRASRVLAASDTLTGLAAGEAYWCRVTDKRGCEVKSDTIRILTHAADTVRVADFFYDNRQRCKGVDNARMEVAFAAPLSLKPMFRLEMLGKEALPLDVEDHSDSSDSIRLDALAPGKYHFWLGFPEEGCRNLLDTVAVIMEMKNNFSLSEYSDTSWASRCLSDPNGKLCFHADGAVNDQSAYVYQGDSLLSELAPTKVIGDRVCYAIDGLGKGSYKVVMENACHERSENEYGVDGVSEYKLMVIDSLSVLKLKCPYDKNGKIAFKKTEWDEFTDFSMICDTTIRRTRVEEETVYQRQEVLHIDTVFVMDTLRHENGETELVYKRDQSGMVMTDTVHRRSFEDVPVVVKKEYVEEEKSKVGYRGGFTTLPDGARAYASLPPNNYTLICHSTLEGCADSTSLDVRVTVPKNVTLKSELLPISCSTYEDGVISFKPKRDAYDSRFVISRDSAIYKGHYDVNYVFEKVTKEVPVDNPMFEGETEKVVTYQPLMLGGDTVAVRINTLNNRSEFLAVNGTGVRTVTGPELHQSRFSYGKEFVSCEWSIKEEGVWKRLGDEDIQMPDSSDEMQTFYYKGSDKMKGPVWGCSHLESFWDDKDGRYSEIGAVTLANLKPAFYAVEVRDTNNCFYRDTFEVAAPENALKIDSVKYDEGGLCNPELRRITAYASGGWGEYLFSFSDTIPEKDGGEEWNGYLGGEATHYDSKNKKGWGRSRFLDPGQYLVTVLDEKGCLVASENRVDVKSNVLVHADTAVSLCPGEKKAQVKLQIRNTYPPKYTGKYLVKQYVSPCNGMVPDCVEESFETVLETNEEVPVIELGAGGHGIFVYEYNPNGTLACGGYVEVNVIDTIPPMVMERKDVHNVKCKGENSGSIELFLTGGKAPYDIIRNSGWGVDDTLTRWHVEQDDLEWFADGIAYYTIPDLGSGSYFFTLRDGNGCRSVMGDTVLTDGSLLVGEPGLLEALMVSPSICANADAEMDEFKGGVAAVRVKGGLPPYSYEVTSNRDGVTISSEVPLIEVIGDRNTLFKYAVVDSNGCRVDTTLKFREETVEVERYDFLASTWMYNGDVIALIDFCGPDVNFDSVSYVFSDPRIELLDKRMYIYDIAGGKEEFRNALSGIDTKSIVPDNFFKKNFRLLVDSLLARHINFIRVNDTTGLSARANGDSCWLHSTVTMSAYFKGCRYEVEKSELKVAYDDVALYGGGVGRKKDILDITVSPNPRDISENGDVTITLTLSSKQECDLYLYHINGVNDGFKRRLTDYVEVDGTEYGTKAYQTKVVLSSDEMAKMDTEVVVVFVKTDHDAAGTYLLQVP